jgi:CheY-like chemotaxis protein/HPt (histidine-containing phosphotransfer) domain-containing protein
MNGEIEVDSTPGQGTTFTFILRFAKAEAHQPTSGAFPYVAGGGRRVLVVDDNEVNRRLLTNLLVKWGLQPVCAESGPEALEILEKAREEKSRFSLVLLDHDMPGMSGCEVAERIRIREGPDQVSILILSSAPIAADQQRAKSLGIARCISKPLRRSLLREAIFQAFELSTPGNCDLDSSAKKTQGRRLQLLLVEDNRTNQELAIRLLQKMGHQVALAVNGREAVEMLEKKSFDLVLMDIQMPVMGGLEATREIREREQQNGVHVPIIAMTAHAMTGDAERYLASGMDGYVSKPIRVELLRAEIERVAGERLQGVNQEMKKTEKELTTAPLDMAELLARVENDLELMRDLVAVFREDFPKQLQSLRAAVENGDAKRVAASAHTLKGMLGNLAAHDAAARAAQLEQLGRNGDVAAFPATFAMLEQDGVKLLSELDNCLSEVRG